MIEYVTGGDARLARLRHGAWRVPVGGGRCRGHRGTGYCELSGALVTRRCGIAHRELIGPCLVQRTFCLDHGATRWTRSDA